MNSSVKFFEPTFTCANAGAAASRKAEAAAASMRVVRDAFIGSPGGDVGGKQVERRILDAKPWRVKSTRSSELIGSRDAGIAKRIRTKRICSEYIVGLRRDGRESRKQQRIPQGSKLPRVANREERIAHALGIARAHAGRADERRNGSGRGSRDHAKLRSERGLVPAEEIVRIAVERADVGAPL